MQTTIRPLTPAELRRTARGIVPRFSDLFGNPRFIPGDGPRNARGEHAHQQPQELSLITEYRDKDILPGSHHTPKGKWVSLVCTPSSEFMTPRFSPHVAPRPGQSWESVGPSCLRIIAWRHTGHYLVLAGDPNMLHDEWHCFVPMTEENIINPTPWGV